MASRSAFVPVGNGKASYCRPIPEEKTLAKTLADECISILTQKALQKMNQMMETHKELKALLAAKRFEGYYERIGVLPLTIFILTPREEFDFTIVNDIKSLELRSQVAFKKTGLATTDNQRSIALKKYNNFLNSIEQLICNLFDPRIKLERLLILLRLQVKIKNYDKANTLCVEISKLLRSVPSEVNISKLRTSNGLSLNFDKFDEEQLGYLAGKYKELF